MPKERWSRFHLRAPVVRRNATRLDDAVILGAAMRPVFNGVQRRSFIASAVSVGAASAWPLSAFSSAPFATSGSVVSAASDLPLFQKIYEYYGKFDEWYEWYAQAFSRAREGAMPDPPPTDTLLAGDIKQVIDAMTNLARTIPTVNPTPLNSLPSLPENPDARRNTLSGHLSHLIEKLDEHAEQISILSDIRRHHDGAERRRVGIIRLGRMLESALRSTPLSILQQYIIYDVLALQPQTGSVYISARELRDVLAERHEANKVILESRRVNLLNELTQLRVALALEGAALRGEAEALNERETELIERGEALDVVKADLARLNASKSEKESLLGQFEEIVEQRTTELSQIESRISSSESTISNLRPKVELGVLGYSACPNRNRYGDCDHTDLKKDFDTRLAGWTQDLSNARSRLAQARARRPLANQERYSAAQRVTQLRAELQPLQAEINMAQTEVDAEQQSLSEAATKLLEDKYRSRATEHARANEAESGRVELVMERLNAPLQSI